MIDFSASWCGPCRWIAPYFENLAAKYPDVEFIKIDVDELSEVAQQFAVEAMPTFLLMKKGQELSRIVGANKDELLMAIQEHIV